MNGYVFFYNNKRVELQADTMYAAKLQAIAHFKPPKSKQHLVHGALAEKDGEEIHHPGELP